MNFVDTHCHIHSVDYSIDPELAINNAIESGVNKLICVGCDARDSLMAVDFVQHYDNTWASIGLHPHEAKMGEDAFSKLASLASRPKVIAIGECGLDYYYNYSPKEDQERALRFQIELALKHDLPLIFHIREAFDDFWTIFDDYKGLRGVVHSFTATGKELDDALTRGLYIGLNGIMTFTSDKNQLKAAKQIPLEKLLLETDSPFLTPKPLRGKVNEPKNVVLTAEFLAELRQVDLEAISTSSSNNVKRLFGI